MDLPIRRTSNTTRRTILLVVDNESMASRRDFLKGSSMILAAGFAGCSVLESGPTTNFSGTVRTEEPLLEDRSLSVENSYPNHYKGLVNNEQKSEQVRWDYIEREVPSLGRELRETDYSNECLVFFGIVLPLSRTTQTGESTVKGDTLRKDFLVTNSSKNQEKLDIESRVLRIEDLDNITNFHPCVKFETSNSVYTENNSVQ